MNLLEIMKMMCDQVAGGRVFYGSLWLLPKGAPLRKKVNFVNADLEKAAMIINQLRLTIKKGDRQ